MRGKLSGIRGVIKKHPIPVQSVLRFEHILECSGREGEDCMVCVSPGRALHGSTQGCLWQHRERSTPVQLEEVLGIKTQSKHVFFSCLLSIYCVFWKPKLTGLRQQRRA